MKTLKKILGRRLMEIGQNLMDGTCSIDDEELKEVASLIFHRRMNIEETCLHFHISRATLNRWQEVGKLPQFHKDSGGKSYLWEDEADECARIYEENRKKE